MVDFDGNASVNDGNQVCLGYEVEDIACDRSVYATEQDVAIQGGFKSGFLMHRH